MNEFTKSLDLTNPEFIKSTDLRKYLATTCQILSLGPEEQEWLTRHLGHDPQVHKDFYRLHANGIELSKISKLLITSEKGRLHQHQGKSIAQMSSATFLEEEVDQGQNRADLTLEEEKSGVDEPLRKRKRTETTKDI